MFVCIRVVSYRNLCAKIIYNFAIVVLKSWAINALHYLFIITVDQFSKFKTGLELLST